MQNTTSTASEPSFTLPADGWFHIENKGLHPNGKAGVVQIVDDEACRSIVHRFNAEADQPEFPGMLIDHEHFKHDQDKETRAYGWLMRLQNRPDGIYGQIRWTETGRRAVEGGDYRFFSTEYDPSDLQVLNGQKKPRQVRPLRLDGLTLTNVNNNKGQKPITNRQNMNTAPEPDACVAAVQASQAAHEASAAADSPAQHEKAAVLHRKAAKAHAAAGHDETAAYHQEMAETHDRTAEGIRAGLINRQTQNDDAAPMVMKTESQNSAQARQLAEQLAAATGRPFDDCWRSIRQANPELFPVLNSDCSDGGPVEPPPGPGATATQIFHGRELAGVENRLRAASARRPTSDAPLPHGELEDAVTDFQIQQGMATYTEAWECLKNRRPGLFNL